jgi:uncharacterized protein YchJ
MNIDTALAAFATADYDLPRDEMAWVLENWPEAQPRLVELLDQAIAAPDLEGGAVGALFFLLHLAAEKQETGIFARVCRLARDAETIDAVFGEAATLPRILIGCFDGDLAPLKSLIEDEAAAETTRFEAFGTLGYLAAAGRIDRAETAAYLGRLRAELRPRAASVAWLGWAETIAQLALDDLADLVKQAFGRRYIHPEDMTQPEFKSLLATSKRAKDPLEPFRQAGITPLTDVVGELSTWYAFSEERRRRDAETPPERIVSDGEEPYLNPLRTVGRNDPCPCGSGKKYKKCCLA